MAIDEFGAGPPLVLLHGLGATHDIWSLVVSRLAAPGRRVVTPDLPGFGDSPAAGDGFKLDAVARRLAQALAGRGIGGPLDLVGHSLGGAVAVALAAARPRLVRRLVLVAPAGLPGGSPIPAISPDLLGAGAAGLYATRRRLAALTDLPWGRRLLLARAVADPAQLTPLQARLMVEASGRSLRVDAALAAVLRADLRPALRAGAYRVGLIWGERDGVVPLRLAAEARAARPDALLELIAGVGHVPMIEAPDRFTAALEQVLAQLGDDDRDAAGPGPMLP